AICGDSRLRGTVAARIAGPISGCGIAAPVKITQIAGITLTTPATLECRTARTFADWVTGSADPAAKRQLGSGISKIWVMGTYACRTRNNRRGARLSEHALGRAVDIGGFWLHSGRKITVQTNWGKGSAGAFLRDVWKRACGPFKTVLGPRADRWHHDHLHLDTSRRKGGTYCR
ncbi:MAG: extensin family protein, partial [Pseudomonadota bacterium]